MLVFGFLMKIAMETLPSSVVARSFGLLPAGRLEQLIQMDQNENPYHAQP